MTLGTRPLRLGRIVTVLSLAAGLAVVPGASASAAPLKAPTTTTARADSMGLAVTVSWTAVSGATGYAVHRSSAAVFTPSPATRLATVTGRTLRDVGATAGRTITYRVVPLGPGGAPGAPGKAATVTTANGMASSRAAATSWVAARQEVALARQTTFSTPYPGGHVGPVSGAVTGAATLPGERRDLPWIAFGAAYDDAYVGPVSGTTGFVAPGGHRVEVFSRPRSAGEPEYWQGSFPLQADGSWTSGEAVARAGAKIAHVVRTSDGARIATSGGQRTGIAGVRVAVYVRTAAAAAAERATSPLSSEGAWSVPWVDVPASGEVIARLVDSATGEILSTSERSGTPGLLRSFTIPLDDPARGTGGQALQDRSWIYDDAVGVLALTAAGQLTRAEAVLGALAPLQQADGSLRFSYDVPTGEPVGGYTRTGASAWVGTAALAYELRSGSTAYRAFATRLADNLLTLQVTTANGFATSDPRYGSLLGGVGYYDANGQFVPTPVQWASTEHNIDAYFFLRDLGYATGEPRFASAAQLVKTSLLTHHWNSAQGRFDQGVGDTAEALDLGSWGGLFLLAVGEDAKATQSATWMERFRLTGAQIVRSTNPDSYNTTYASPGPIAGYKPYGAGYADPPATVWAEGTWGAVLFKMRRGQDVTTDLQSLQRLQAADPEGGFVQATAGRSASPYEFHVWPAVAGTGWAALVAHDANLLWKRDRWNEDPAAR